MWSVHPLLSMKLLYIALFTIQLLNVDAESEPVSAEVRKIACNDTGVFAAVDFTLRKFNVQKTGNQFALYQVIEAEAQAVGSGNKYLITFSIYETVCPVESKVLWRACNYKAPREASTGQCKSNVHINRVQRINEVISYNCTVYPDQESWIFPEKATCTGCEHPLPIDHHILNKTSAFATETFNSNSTYEYYFRIATVYKLTQQVVAGIKYKMTFLNQETECSKDHPIPNGKITSCPFKPEGVKLHCTSTLLEVVWLHHIATSVTCDPVASAPMPRTFITGWGPFLMMPAEGEVLNSTEAHVSPETESADTLVSITCPGKPWKSLYQVKPALPPVKEHDDSDESQEEILLGGSHETQDGLSVDA